MRKTKDNFSITDDIAALDMEFAINALHNTYWADKRPQSVIEKSISNSAVISLFDGTKQIGLARIISDFATFAYICDVYIDPNYRKRGLGIWLMQYIMEHPSTQVNLVMLATRDAHELYKKFGFVQSEEIAKKFMIKRNIAIPK